MAAIVVVGAGLSGLTCAHRLRRAGHDVEVLESGAVLGGRVQTDVGGGFVIERGAGYFAPGDRNLQALLAACGLMDRVNASTSEDGVVRAGRLAPMGRAGPGNFIRSPLLSASAKLRLSRLAYELFQQQGQLDPRHPEAAGGDLDGEAMADYLERMVGAEARDYLIAPALGRLLGGESDEFSAAIAMLCLRVAVSGRRSQSLAGGLGALIESLSQGVPTRTRCTVHAIESQSAGVRIRYRAGAREPGQGERESSVMADAAVVAVPGRAAAALCPKLTPDERGFFERVEYIKGLNVQLVYDDRPTALDDYFSIAFPRVEGQQLLSLTVEQQRRGAAPAGRGLVGLSLRGGAVEALFEEPDEKIAEFVLDELARTPVQPLLGGRLPAAVRVHRWPAMLPRFGVGHLGALARFLRRAERSPRLAFAGDYLVGPHMEGAVTSGMRAATEVLQTMG